SICRNTTRPAMAAQWTHCCPSCWGVRRSPWIAFLRNSCTNSVARQRGPESCRWTHLEASPYFSDNRNLTLHSLDLADQTHNQDRFLTIKLANCLCQRRNIGLPRLDDLQYDGLLRLASVIAGRLLQGKAVENLPGQPNDFASIYVFCINPINRFHGNSA